MTLPMREIIKAACAVAGISRAELVGDCQIRALVDVRTAIAVLGRRQGFSQPQIGRWMQRDHTTVLHHLRRAERMVGKVLEAHNELVSSIEQMASDEAPIAAVPRCACGAVLPPSKDSQPRRMCDGCKAAKNLERSRRFRANKAAGKADPAISHTPPPLEQDRSEICSPQWWANNDARFRAAFLCPTLGKPVLGADSKSGANSATGARSRSDTTSDVNTSLRSVDAQRSEAAE